MSVRDARLRTMLRVAGFAGAAAVALSQWFALDAHGAGLLVALAVVASALLVLALPAQAARLSRPGAAAVMLGALLVVAAAALLAAGVPLALLAPRRWDDLGAGISHGVGAIPATTVPYRGLDPWVRTVIRLGGLALLALATLGAAWPRGRGRPPGVAQLALLGLGVLFTVPAIQITSGSPWVVGSAFALGLVPFVLADRAPLRLAPFGAAALALAIVLAALVAPALDGARPVVDVQKIASSLQRSRTDVFDFDHHYGPVDWPRDGRVVLRVRAKEAAYWKAEDLDLFDGVRWRHSPDPNPLLPIVEGMSQHPSWRQQLHVTVGAMRTSSFIAAGETESVSHAPRQPVQVRPGGFESRGGTLARGDSWDATVYAPTPTPKQMASAGTRFPRFLEEDLSMLVRSPSRTSDDARALVRFGPYGSGEADLLADPGLSPAALRSVLDAAGYGQTYALAKRLAGQSSSPYDFVRRVERYLAADRFVYTEKAKDSRLPIPDFLFKTHRGYCQHFSGAMALLLRMGGVPARVAGGFAPGTFDASSGEYVARDLDAHSWVEAWFPGIGWATFDPTPAAAPPRLRFALARDEAKGSASTSAVAADQGRLPQGGDRGDDAAAPSGGPGAQHGPPWTAITLGLAALVALGLAVVARRRNRRAWTQVAPELRELERALARSGRRPGPETTLSALEAELGGSEAAREYLRAVRDARFAPGPAQAPTAQQRRALRRELGEGRGAAGRVRALYALPPRIRRRGDLH